MVYLHTYAVWWVVVSGLLIEDVIYYWAWRRPLLSTVALTVGVNAASAIGGAIYSYGSLMFTGSPIAAETLLVSSPVLIPGITVAIELATGIYVFKLPKTKKTAIVILLANILTVGIAVYETARLTTQSVSVI